MMFVEKENVHRVVILRGGSLGASVWRGGEQRQLHSAYGNPGIWRRPVHQRELPPAHQPRHLRWHCDGSAPAITAPASLPLAVEWVAHARRRTANLPLPKGEGRGEGERRPRRTPVQETKMRSQTRLVISDPRPQAASADKALPMKTLSLLTMTACLAALAATAQVPQLLNFQGRVAVNGTNFDGTGLFRFALVNSNGTATFWSNDGTGSGGSEPSSAVSLTVSAGFYSVLLGDATLSNMTVIPATVFTNGDVRIRTWFNDGTSGSQLLVPDQRIAAVGYAILAGNIVDGAITTTKLADGAVTSAKIADGAVGVGNLASNLTLTVSNISFSSPVTRYYSIPAVAFNATTDYGLYEGPLMGGSARYGIIFYAPLMLPDGATITGFQARVLNAVSNAVIPTVRILRYARSDDSLLQFAEVSATTISSQPQTLVYSTPLSEVVDNFNFRYSVQARFLTTDPQRHLKDVLVTYTVSKPLP